MSDVREIMARAIGESLIKARLHDRQTNPSMPEADAALAALDAAGYVVVPKSVLKKLRFAAGMDDTDEAEHWRKAAGRPVAMTHALSQPDTSTDKDSQPG